MPTLVGTIFAILLFGLFFRRLGQPLIVGYLAVGVLLGPSGLGVVQDVALISRLGEIGVVLLLFFAGMEVSLPSLAARWRVPVFGTLLQILASVGCVVAIGAWQGWSMERSVLLGFVISLSSTAVVLKLLADRNEMESPIGRDVVGVLLAQDLAVIPMLIVIGILGGGATDLGTVGRQVVGGIAAIAILVFVGRADLVKLPMAKWLRADHELQVFGAFLLGFGMAFLTGLAGLSVALGAFIAGIVVGAARETEWVHTVLHPFQVIFLAAFFVSVGMMLDLHFIAAQAPLIGILLVAVVFTNTALNATIFRILGRTWRNSIYGGALLSQVGEFSFVLAAVGREVGLIEEFGYQVTVAVIALSLLASPMWIGIGRRVQRGGETAPEPS